MAVSQEKLLRAAACQQTFRHIMRHFILDSQRVDGLFRRFVIPQKDTSNEFRQCLIADFL